MKIYSKFTIALFVTMLFALQTMAQFSGGDGTSGNPYQIATLTDLQTLSEDDSYWVADLYFEQTADIDASATSSWNSGAGFSPIGNSSNKFFGNYDGQNYTISNLSINKSTEDYIGLFGYIGDYSNAATIANINLTDVNIIGNNYVGSIIGASFSSTITNCSSTGSVSGNSTVGGIVGSISNSNLSQCGTECNVEGSSYIGGFVGCTYTDGSVYTISKSYASGNVSGESYVGGFIGWQYIIDIENCYSTGDVTRTTGSDLNVGSFSGNIDGEGLSGSHPLLKNSYATGTVYSSGSPAVVWGDGDGLTDEKGFVGVIGEYFEGEFINNFYDSETTQQSTASGATAKTTAEMKTEATFTNAGWDFSTIWKISSGMNNGYPAFQWMPTPPSPMQLVFTFTEANTEIKLPLYGTVNCTVDWGDGSATEDFTTEGNKSHTFASAGTDTVTISGTVTQFGSGNTYFSGLRCLTEVVSFGELGLISLSGAFYATNITSVPADLPSSITDLSYCFFHISSTSITNLENWDVSNVTNMEGLFSGASVFNQNINSWDVSNVTNMKNLFSYTQAFDQALNNWNVDNVTNMEGLFANASSFNQPLNNWNVDNVINMRGMFANTDSFNQNINDWNVSNVTDMSYMFNQAIAFNQPLNNWDVSNVTDMCQMFCETENFNQNINDWNVSNVTNMYAMFAITDSFNQPLNNWDVSSVTNMSNMFERTLVFNQPLNNWDISSVNSLELMFKDATSFNQDISSWNTANVTSMYAMFWSATSFDQDLSSWDITSVSYMSKMFELVTLSTANYDAILTGWAAQNVQDNVGFDGGNSQYSCGAADARQSLIDNHNWVITDGGFVPDTIAPVPDLTTLPNVEAECEVTSLTAPTATDNCSGTVTVTNDATLPITTQGTTVVTWTYEDEEGNTSTQTQNVVIEDVTAPTITCVENQEFTLQEGETVYTVSGDALNPVSTDDNCEVASIVNDFTTTETLDGANFPVGLTTVTWTVTDVAGNETTCEFDVLVNAFAGIEDLSEIGISIYPNPTTGIFTIETEGNFDVTITDISGKEILKFQNFKTSKVNLSNNANGVYFIKFQNNETVKTVKIIKQ